MEKKFRLLSILLALTILLSPIASMTNNIVNAEELNIGIEEVLENVEGKSEEETADFQEETFNDEEVSEDIEDEVEGTEGIKKETDQASGTQELEVEETQDDMEVIETKQINSLQSQEDEIREFIKVRVEGFSDTLYNEEILFTQEMNSTLDLLESAVGAENIDGGGSPSGYFITGILGEEGAPNSGWSYYVKFKSGDVVQPMLAVDKFEGLTNYYGELVCEEVVFYVTSYSGANILTKVPVVTVENDGASFIINITNNEVGNTPIKDVDIKIQGGRSYRTDEEGQAAFTLYDEGIYNITISKDHDFPMIVRQHLVLVSEGAEGENEDNEDEEEPIEDFQKKINSAIDGLRDYFTLMNERLDSSWNTHPTFYNPLEALALNVTSKNIEKDVEDIANKVKINNNAGTLPYAMNIIALISSGQNPQDYVDLLVAGQQEDGSFKVGRVEQTEWSVIALDMAQADYNEEKAANRIIERNQNRDSVDLLAIAVTALAPHKDIEGVEDFIDSKLVKIKSQQLETGGFEVAMGMENSLTLSYVVSALVANGIDPLTDEEWIVDGNTLLDVLLKYKSLNYFIYNDVYGDYYLKDEATEQAFIALTDLQQMESSYRNVQKITSNVGTIGEGLSKIRDYLTTTEGRTNSSLQDVDVFYTWLDALAIIHTSNDLEKDYLDIQSKLKLNRKDDVLSLSEDIMGLIASGEIFGNLDKDYIGDLVALQDEQGEFKEEGKESNVYKQSYAIIALDMANGEYDVDKAVESLINMAEEGHFESVEETAWALIALSKHKDVDGVSQLIDSSIAYLKSNQSDDGGYDMMGYGDTPQYTGLVIQALIANGIDPLSSQWEKGDKTLLESLLNDQLADGTFRWCEMFGNYVDITSTERGFAALADLYTGESMYHSVESVLDSSDIIENTLDEVSEYVKEQNQYNYLQSMALSILGVDKEELSQKFELREDEIDRIYIAYDDPTEAHAKNIMGIIAIGENPRDFQGKNYVTILEESQRENGEFNIEGDKTNRIGDQVYAIIALDMADGEYNFEKAIDILTDNYEAISKPSIYVISETIIALSNHKDMEGIQEKIDDYIEDLKEYQTETGGFGYYKNDTDESSEYISIAIQAIVAAGKDPLSIEFQKNGKSALDGLMTYKRNNYFIYDQTKSSYKEYTEQATGMALAALVDLYNQESMYHILEMEYEEDNQDLTIKEVIEALRSYYSNKDKFTFRSALGYNHTSDNLGIDLIAIGNKFKTNESPVSASEHVGNIMGLIASGKDPYNHNGKDYVRDLANVQNAEGKFIIGVYDDYPTTQAFSVLALDMVGADYNKDKARDALLGYQNEDGSFNGVDETGMVLVALGKYKDESRVQTAISKGLNYLKEQQDENTGGFIVWGGENGYSASAVLQGLVAVGENPLSLEWTKDGKTIIDSLMNFYKDGYFENVSKWGSGSEIDSITEQAFIALSDVYRGKSMFNEILFVPGEFARIAIYMPDTSKITEGDSRALYVIGYDDADKVVPVGDVIWTSSDTEIAEIDEDGNIVFKKAGEVRITAQVKGTEIKDSIDLEIFEKDFEIEYMGDVEVINGNQANAKVRIKNLSQDAKPATLIITLYEENTDVLSNYSAVRMEINSQEELELSAGFLVPKSGDYYIKVFVWDDLDTQNIIMEDSVELDMAS